MEFIEPSAERRDFKAKILSHLSLIVDLRHQGVLTPEQTQSLINSFGEVSNSAENFATACFHEGFQRGDQDQLTELPRRGGMVASFNRHKQYDGPDRRGSGPSRTVALVFDIADLKATNECMGSKYGDEMIKRFGQMLQRMFRRGLDFVGRLGGDEFVVLLNNPSDSFLKEICEQLEKAKQQECFYESGEIGKVPFGFRHTTIILDHAMNAEEISQYLDPKMGSNRREYPVDPEAYAALNPAA